MDHLIQKCPSKTPSATQAACGHIPDGKISGCGFCMPARAAIYEPTARERASTARTRCAAILDHMEWFVSADR